MIFFPNFMNSICVNLAKKLLSVMARLSLRTILTKQFSQQFLGHRWVHVRGISCVSKATFFRSAKRFFLLVSPISNLCFQYEFSSRGCLQKDKVTWGKLMVTRRSLFHQDIRNFWEKVDFVNSQCDNFSKLNLKLKAAIATGIVLALRAFPWWFKEVFWKNSGQCANVVW